METQNYPVHKSLPSQFGNAKFHRSRPLHSFNNLSGPIRGLGFSGTAFPNTETEAEMSPYETVLIQVPNTGDAKPNFKMEVEDAEIYDLDCSQSELNDPYILFDGDGNNPTGENTNYETEEDER